MNYTCDICSKFQASVHQYEVPDTDDVSTVRVVHMCIGCAKSHGIAVSGTTPNFPQMMGLLGKALLDSAASAATVGSGSSLSCPDCGWTEDDFRTNSRFGCPADYDVFSGLVSEVLERIHGTSEHVQSVHSTELTKLGTELEYAITAEQYEQAAKLRDRIKNLEDNEKDTEDLDF